MTPYLWLQTLYVAISFAITFVAWWSAGRFAFWRSSPRRRAVFTSGVHLAVCAVVVAFWRVFDHPHAATQFMGIAWLYYGATFCIPAFVAVECVRARRAGRRLDRALVAATALVVACGLDALLVEPNRLQVVEFRVEVPEWSAGAKPLRIVHVSDLQTVGPNDRQRRAVELINSLEPDLIVVTGDFLSGPFWNIEPAFRAGREFFDGLRAKLGIVAVDGHAEREADRVRLFAGTGVRYLKNCATNFPLDDGRELSIFGVTTLAPDFSALDDRRVPGRVKLVASHVPDLTTELDGKQVDLHLAGHTHGGQICLPLLGPPMTLSSLPREFARGLHAIGDHRIHVSPGIGMEGHHAPRIRFLCPPEIDLLVIEGANQSAQSSSAVR